LAHKLFSEIDYTYSGLTVAEEFCSILEEVIAMQEGTSQETGEDYSGQA